MKDWYSGIYKSFIMASVVAFVISMFTTGKVSYGSELTGYSALIIGIMMILIILFKSIFHENKDTSNFQLLTAILMTTGPFILKLGVIGFILYLMIVYKTAIINEHVSPSYHTFSNIAIILFLIQVYIMYVNISSDKFTSSGKISKITASMIYLFGILSLMTSIILYIILKYFRTDG
jgi:hypothetical protein